MNSRIKSNAACARLANNTIDYERLELDKSIIKPWEDGMRTEGKKGSYEWWYVDSEFDDGTTIVVVFYTKDHFDINGPARPTVDIEINYANGKNLKGSINEHRGVVLNASKTECNVSIKNSFLKYQDNHYILHYDDGQIKYEAIMTSTLQMWRPGTGHTLFGDDESKYFAWFVAQPSSKIEATLNVDGVSKELHGTGYHDHNWGNVSMNKLINHWYWGRAKVGNYHIIACDIIAEKEYGYKRLPIIMIAKNGKLITDDQSITTIKRNDTILHPDTKKFMDNHLTYEQQISDNEKYTIEFIRNRDIICDSLLNKISPIKRNVAKLLGANPTYTRVLGEVKMTIVLDNISEVIKNEGLWEQMFFGSNKEAIIYDEKEIQK